MIRMSLGAWLCCAVFAAATVLAQTKPASTQPAGVSSALDGHWEGTIKAPGMPLAILVDIKRESDKLVGKIDIPQQGAKDLKLESINLDGTHVTFAIRGIPGKPRFDGQLQAGKIAGTFSQSFMNVPFDLGRERVAALLRPQEPKPPFPYKEEEVTYQHDGMTTGGTLTIPPGAGPFPAVLLITGSGKQDRDESLMGHRPFLIIADRLARAGIAVLRVDDRDIGKSTGNFSDATTEDFAKDAEAGINYLKTRSEIAKDKIGLVGHSEGGVIAPLVASRSKDVAFIIMLAGTGAPGDQLLLKQNDAIARAAGTSEQSIAEQDRALRAVMDELMRGGDDAALKEKIRELLRTQIAASPMAATTKPSDEEMNELMDETMKELGGKWFRFFLAYDPRPALRKVKVPVLALNGELDKQVDADQNLPQIEKALKEAGNKDVTVKKIPGVNHLFQTCRTGSPREYGQINETMNEDVLKLMTDWIGQHCRTQQGKG